MKKYKVGDKLKPKKGCECKCECYMRHKGEYVVITGAHDFYSYNIYDKNNIRVDGCCLCFRDQDLEPYKEHTFKVGDKVQIKDHKEGYCGEKGCAHMTSDMLPFIGRVVTLSKEVGNWFEIKEDAGRYKWVWSSCMLGPVSDKKKQFIVHCPTEELWRKVQEKMFSEGYKWRSGEKYIDACKYEEQSCIFFGEDDMAYASRPFYEKKLPTIPIIEASEYLGEEDKEKEMEATRREYMTQTYVDMMEAFSKSYIIDPYMLNPIKNSPAKEHKNPIMTGLKKVTNFIDSLQEPLKSYIRLGWVELEEDEYVVTEVGQAYYMDVVFGLTPAKTLEEYAEKEVARIKKEEEGESK